MLGTGPLPVSLLACAGLAPGMWALSPEAKGDQLSHEATLQGPSVAFADVLLGLKKHRDLWKDQMKWLNTHSAKVPVADHLGVMSSECHPPPALMP